MLGKTYMVLKTDIEYDGVQIWYKNPEWFAKDAIIEKGIHLYSPEQIRQFIALLKEAGYQENREQE